jgi:nucleotide-binding universal stress UspA family protein
MVIDQESGGHGVSPVAQFCNHPRRFLPKHAKTRSERGGLGAETVLDSAVIPLDGSELAESVLPAAAELAKMLDLEMVLFRAYELPASAYYGSEDYLPNYDQLKEQMKQQVRNYLADKMTKLKAEGVTRVSSVIVEGAGPNEIVGYARNTANNLVAMCTHGRSGLKRLVLGSVTKKLCGIPETRCSCCGPSKTRHKR